MAQSSGTPIVKPDDGRFWTDGWDGYPAARRRLLDTLVKHGAHNPLVLGGDVHTFYATSLRPDFAKPVSRQNPVVATEFVGTSVTSSSRTQARTEAHVANNPHMLYGRSDKRGYLLLEVTPKETVAHCMGLDDVRNAKSPIAQLAAFRVADGEAGAERLG